MHHSTEFPDIFKVRLYFNIPRSYIRIWIFICVAALPGNNCYLFCEVVVARAPDIEIASFTISSYNV